MNMNSPWKILEKPTYKTGIEYQQALLSGGYRISDWIVDISSKPDFVTETAQWPLKLVRISLSSLNFTGPTHLSDFYVAANEAGFKTLPPEAALALRLNYNEQPVGEWLRIATPLDGMIDSDGVPHLPKLGKALGHFYIETYWAYPQAIFHPHNEFVFIDSRSE